ncbi:DUF3187 family protein [Nitratiruptor sp. YY09-18]|uniref:DUF3187 family protein n=1 Tax=Nitratiruptor sp. YY09-18 TaxID=2724901 RepID=UPI0019158BEF|nr:DUF3187 family protein [Nitratiruptor sp. YY09-18]BCD68831.1 hypothetical protein NitYY0918_C1750 [Nitratiruptor sp. YY09-18]
MHKILFLILCSLSLFAAPLQFAIQHPWRMAFYPLTPTDTTVKKSTTFTFTETNDYENEEHLILDYELSTLTLTQTYNLDTTKAVTLHLPLCQIWGGFMDKPLDWFHDVTGLLNGEEHNIKGDNRVFIDFGNIHQNSPYAFIGNATFEFKQLLPWHPKSTNFAYRVGIKIPTAPKSSGFGTKKVDYLVGFIGSYKKWLYNIDLLYLGKNRITNLAKSKRWAYSLYLFYSYKKWEISWRYISSFYTSDHDWFDSPSQIVNVTYQLNDRWSIFASENLTPFYGSPDFTIGAQLKF